MKTYMEARETICRQVSLAAPQKDHDEAVAQMADQAQRFEAIANEIGEDKVVAAALELTAKVSCCLYHATLSAYTLGVRVGMEMERSEIGVEA